MKNSSSILKRVVDENRKNEKAYAVMSCQFAIEKEELRELIRT